MIQITRNELVASNHRGVVLRRIRIPEPTEDVPRPDLAALERITYMSCASCAGVGQTTTWQSRTYGDGVPDCQICETCGGEGRTLSPWHE